MIRLKTAEAIITGHCEFSLTTSPPCGNALALASISTGWSAPMRQRIPARNPVHQLVERPSRAHVGIGAGRRGGGPARTCACTQLAVAPRRLVSRRGDCRRLRRDAVGTPVSDPCSARSQSDHDSLPLFSAALRADRRRDSTQLPGTGRATRPTRTRGDYVNGAWQAFG